MKARWIGLVVLLIGALLVGAVHVEAMSMLVSSVPSTYNDVGVTAHRAAASLAAWSDAGVRTARLGSLVTWDDAGIGVWHLELDSGS